MKSARSFWKRLDKPILSKVSRSFSLSLSVLPGPLQLPMGLAYLLARASDTIADASHIDPEHRLEHLDHFRSMLETGPRVEHCRKIDGEIGRNLENDAERRLISRLHEALACLHACSEWDRAEIVQVLRTIITGQSLDVSRFGLSRPGELVALQSSEALIEYTDLVAGCVGVFWTNTCRHNYRGFSRLSMSELLAWGSSFGRGLQLVNILRDLPSDINNGRCYLPIDISRFEADPVAELMHARDPWIQVAYSGLTDGWQYARSLRSVRLRQATWLPALLGIHTLHRVAEASWEVLVGGVKLTRPFVKRLCGEALLGALSTRLMDRSYHRAVALHEVKFV